MSLDDTDSNIETDSTENLQFVSEKDIDIPTSATASKFPMSQAASTAVTANLQKIAPKPPTVVKSAPLSSGKIVYIKSPNGASQPIRIGGSIVQNAASSSGAITASSSGPIQIIKAADGNIYQIKPKPQASTGTASAGGANNARLIVKNSDGSRVILTTSKQPTAPTTSVAKLAIPSTKLVSTTSATKVSSSVASEPSMAGKSIKTLPQTAKIIVQPSGSTEQGASKPSASGQNVVRLPQTTQLRAVNVAGKGLQYVRVLNPGAANSNARPVVLQRSASTSATTAPTKPTQFITKKLEVTPLTTNATTIQRFAIKSQQSPTSNQPNKSSAVLLNNTQVNVLNSSIDIKTVSLSNNKSYEIAMKNSVKSPNGDQKSIVRNGREEKRSASPDPTQSGQYSSIKMSDTDTADGSFATSISSLAAHSIDHFVSEQAIEIGSTAIAQSRCA